jgi:hypothetical protein
VRWSDGADGRLPPLRPATGDLVLLADPGFVAEPHLYIVGIDAPLVRDRRQCGGPLFLKASTAPAFCA